MKQNTDFMSTSMLTVEPVQQFLKPAVSVSSGCVKTFWPFLFSKNMTAAPNDGEFCRIQQD